MEPDTYLGQLQAAAGAVQRAERDVLLRQAAADAFASALFGLREEFLRAQHVEQIGHPIAPADAQALSDALRSTINLPPKRLSPTEQRWTPDYVWAVDAIEQMLLLLGMRKADLSRPWPWRPLGEPDDREQIRRDRGHLRD